MPATRGFYDECLKGEVQFSLGFMKPSDTWRFGGPRSFGSPGTGGALDPEQARVLGVSLEAAVKRMMQAGRAPCVVVSPDIRRYLRAFAERRCPELAVLSFRELEPEVSIRPFETIGFGKAAA